MTPPADRATCHVWLVTTDLAPADRSDLIDLLDADERSRRARLRRPDDRERFTTGAILLRRAIARHVGIDWPATPIVVDRSCPDCDQPHGRPTVDLADVHVSVSHAGNHVAVAVTAAGPVGIDVEVLTESFGDLVAATCASSELQGIRRAHDFAVVWTRKEAVLKATGAGLRRDPREAVVTPPGERPALLRLGDEQPACSLHDLDVDARHAGAVAVLTDSKIGVEIGDGAALMGW